MDRREFRLLTGTGLAGASLLAHQQSARRNQRLPANGHHYRKVSSYVEEVPVPEYQWASVAACQAFRDITAVRLEVE
jgi:hypothetical protein